MSEGQDAFNMFKLSGDSLELPTTEERKDAQQKLERMMPFQKWCAERPRTEYEIEVYRLFENDLRRVVAGQPSELDFVALLEFFTALRH